jgi:hypothetical protein
MGMIMDSKRLLYSKDSEENWANIVRRVKLVLALGD